MTVEELARQFPDAVTLRERSRVLATLDAVVSPDWESRYFSYDSSWGTTPLITVCLWRLSGVDEAWVHGEIDFPRGVEGPDGANWLFESLIDYSPLSYLRFAQDCYYVGLEAGPVAEIYALSPMSRAFARSLNPAVSFEEIVQELEGIGYPVAE